MRIEIRFCATLKSTKGMYSTITYTQFTYITKVSKSIRILRLIMYKCDNRIGDKHITRTFWFWEVWARHLLQQGLK
jgi:hypothetical protein